MSRFTPSRFIAIAAVTMGAALAFVACGGDDTTSNPDLAQSGADMTVCTGGAVTGAADSHCGGAYATVVAAECSVDAGTPDPGTGGDYGETLYGTSGYDDDCKYQVSYTVDPVCENAGVYFTVIVKNAVGGAAVTGAKTRAEVFLDATHPAPNSGVTTTETTPGTYRVGPIRFDKAGQWTSRFHFFEDCTDSPTSPHGHAAFFIHVP